MIWNPFKIISKKFLGIDIGTTAIKIVELSRFGERVKLENYGEIEISSVFEKPFRVFERNNLLLSSRDISQAIDAIIEEARIDCRKVIFSIPDYSSFFTNFRLPTMTKEELPQAVKYEARIHIPLPLSEVTLDWQIIGGRVSEKNALDILLVSIPNEVINQYQEIARLSNLELQALEAEAYGLLRSSASEEKKAICLVDAGAQSTTISIVDNRVLKRSHSFNISGNEFTQRIAKSLNIDYDAAERLKKEYGIVASIPNEGRLKNHNIREILLPLIDLIIIEIGKICDGFYQSEKKEIEKIVLAGGAALIPGLKEYFFEGLKKETQIASPFINIFCPPILEGLLKEMGPSYAVAVGAALRGLE